MPTIHVEVDGLHLFGGEAHRDYLEAVRQGEREAHMAELFARDVRSGALVVDVGAFLGHFTLIAARRVGTKGRVVAFEPDPRDRPWLERNVVENGFADRVEVVPLAISDSPGRLRLFLAEQDRSQSSLYPTRDDGPPIDVQATTLDGFLAEAAVDVVKIDVEGAELRALDGMRRTIELGRPTMFVEWNPQALRRAGVAEDELLRRLEGLGYRLELIDETRRGLVEPVFPEHATYVNLRCVPA